MQDIKWGIIGCGGIANAFATGLKALETGTLLAGASHTPGKAQAFAEKHGLERFYSTYEALAADPDVDAVYVATTHNFHYENVKLCLEHGKHVLCEKPFTINAAQAEELIALARKNNLFMMEAVWTRFLPAIRGMQELVAAGVIGEVLTVKADFCISGEFGAEHRLRNKALAGGALLDLGIYPITFADIVFDAWPSRIQSSAVIGDTGVDDRSAYLFDYEAGRRAILYSSFTTAGLIEGLVCGSKGCIRVPRFLGATQFLVELPGQAVQCHDYPVPEPERFKFEIAHAMDCIAANKLESDILPLAKTLGVMRIMDTLRAQWGLKYEGE